MDADNQPHAGPRQRWRLTFRHDPEAMTPAAASTRPGDAWAEALDRSGLPVVRSGERARIALAAPLPVGALGERELADVFLTERRAVDEVRRAIGRVLPPGLELVELHDAWLGEPALPAQVVAADYRVVLGDGPGAPSPSAIGAACSGLIAAPEIPRSRIKGARTVTYDLRPLLDALAVLDAGPPVVLGIRTRFDPERGAGRPDEVVAALGDTIGRTLAVEGTTRQRLWLASELASIPPARSTK
jgi:radical SAM-linked protein